MTVYLAAADESGTTSRNGHVVYGGFVAPASDWNEWFIPAWEESVLRRTPALKWFHVVDLRDDRWLWNNGITPRQADVKFDAAAQVIRSSGSLSPIISDFSNEHYEAIFDGQEFEIEGRAYKFKREYIAFKGWVYSTLLFVARQCPDASRVDFVFEGGNEEVDGMFCHLFENVAAEMVAMDKGIAVRAAGLKGSIRAAKKDFVPVQFADFLVWHSRRLCQTVDLPRHEYRRFANAVANKGIRYIWGAELLRNLKHEIDARAPSTNP